MKNKESILEKLGIKELNQMQIDSQEAIDSNSEIVILSPTGTGKTLAFLLPILSELDFSLSEVQALVLVPARELAIQIEQVAREMGSGYKINAVYGGRTASKDRMDLANPPAILIGTPGRVADHIRRKTFSTNNIKILILDEFDKSLEVGFEHEMREIIESLSNVKKKILTSATKRIEIPSFVKINDSIELNYLKETKSQLKLIKVASKKSERLSTLENILRHAGNGNGIIFCNFKDSIQTVSDHLRNAKIDHSCFYGGLEQIDRERALIKFRNGTSRILIATDLAARGIDVPELDFIVHYELPMKKEEFVHRNGRTARMNSNGTAYIINVDGQDTSYIENAEEKVIKSDKKLSYSNWKTIYISGGRKDKISKGDIAGLFIKQGGLTQDELGIIELKQDCAFVAVTSKKANKVVEKLNNSRLKKKKVRISIMK